MFVCTSYLSHGQTKKVLSLDDCVNMALGRNFSLSRSSLEIKKNELRTKQTLYASYPNLNLSVLPNATLGRSLDPYTNQFIDKNITASNLGLLSSVGLFNGFQQKYQIKQAKNNEQLAGMIHDLNKKNVVMSVYAAYQKAATIKESIKVKEQQISLTTNQLKETKTQLDLGILTEIDLLNLTTQAELEDLDLSNEKSNLELALSELKQIINIPLFTAIDIAEIDFLGTSQPPTTTESALNKHPSVQMAVLKNQMADDNLRQIRYGKLPSLFFSVGLNSTYSSAAPQSIFLSDGGKTTYTNRPTTNFIQTNGKVERVWETVAIPSGTYKDFDFYRQLAMNKYISAGLSIKVSIFNGNQQRIRETLAALDKKIVESENQETVLALRNDIERLMQKIDLSKKRIEVYTKKRITTQGNFTNIADKFKLGYATANDYIMAKTALEKVEIELAQSKIAYYFDLKTLEMYLR